MPTPKAKELYSIVGFDFGIDNLNEPTALKTESLGPYSYKYRVSVCEATNVDITYSGGISRRDGFSLVSSGAVTSLWSDSRLSFGLCVRGGNLCRVSEQGALVTLTSVLNPTVAYAYCNNGVLWSDGDRCGRVSASGEWRYWGLPVPPKPAVSTGTGSLTGGRYRVAITCVNSYGEESGCAGFVEVDVDNKQKLIVSGVPVAGRSDITSFYVYCSLPFGETLYFSRALDLGLGSCEIDLHDLKKGMELTTLFLSPPNGASHIRVEFGRAVIARDNYLAVSQPLNFGLFNLSHGTIPFDSTITGLEFVEDGWFVGTTTGIYFIQGTEPAAYKLTRLDFCGVVQGTMRRIDRKYTQDKLGQVVFWLGTNGCFYQGGAGGRVARMAEDRFKASQFSSGTTLFRQTRGQRSVLFTLTDSNPDYERGIEQDRSLTIAPFELSINTTTEDAT